MLRDEDLQGVRWPFGGCLRHTCSAAPHRPASVPKAVSACVAGAPLRHPLRFVGISTTGPTDYYYTPTAVASSNSTLSVSVTTRVRQSLLLFLLSFPVVAHREYGFQSGSRKPPGRQICPVQAGLAW